MHSNPNRMVCLAVAAAIALAAAGCGGDDSTEPPPPEPTVVMVVVRDASTGTLVGNANVVLYEADTGESVLRGLTGPTGAILFERHAGNYYVNVSAQGFEPSPPMNISPVPFWVDGEDTTVQEVSLEALDVGGNAGYVYGSVEPGIANFLIIAESRVSSDKYFTASGPDGVFVVYNLPFGDYSLTALKSGYMMTDPVSASLGVGVEVDTVLVPVAEYTGSILAGNVTFLAAENSVVDITLLDPETRAVIPGLSTSNGDTNLTYRIDCIPDGSYLAWASLKNDGYVIDPDWVFKNPGGLDITFTVADSTRLNFSVTDAITLVSPTNPAESTFPAQADSVVPAFSWLSYPSAKEYFIEVRDLNGRRLWGGFEDDGTVNHAFIGPGVRSVRYNFDNQPDAPALEPGKIYQWRLWADKGTELDSFVEQLISASEDLRGLFQTPAE
jgi:hypothetical protein